MNSSLFFNKSLVLLFIDVEFIPVVSKWIKCFQKNGTATAGEDADGEEITGKDRGNSRETFKADGGQDKSGYDK